MIRHRNTDPALDRLRPLPLLAGWEDSELAMLALEADVLWTRQPYSLAREGLVPREFHLLLNGHAEVAGAGRPPHVIGPGTLIGAKALLAGAPSPETVVTCEPTRVLAFGWAAVHRIEKRVAEACALIA